jgi:hypothetical protein
MVSTSPRRLKPGWQPDSQSRRVSIQSRPGYFACSSGVQISPVGRRRTKTALSGCPAPILARTRCRPRGVQKLPFFSPGPFFAVETE